MSEWNYKEDNLRRGVSFVQERPGLPQPGVVTSRTVLNVFGPTGHGGRYIYDSTKVSKCADPMF